MPGRSYLQQIVGVDREPRLSLPPTASFSDRRHLPVKLTGCVDRPRHSDARCPAESRRRGRSRTTAGPRCRRPYRPFAARPIPARSESTFAGLRPRDAQPRGLASRPHDRRRPRSPLTADLEATRAAAPALCGTVEPVRGPLGPRPRLPAKAGPSRPPSAVPRPPAPPSFRRSACAGDWPVHRGLPRQAPTPRGLEAPASRLRARRRDRCRRRCTSRQVRRLRGRSRDLFRPDAGPIHRRTRGSLAVARRGRRARFAHFESGGQRQPRSQRPGPRPPGWSSRSRRSGSRARRRPPTPPIPRPGTVNASASTSESRRAGPTGRRADRQPGSADRASRLGHDRPRGRRGRPAGLRLRPGPRLRCLVGSVPSAWCRDEQSREEVPCCPRCRSIGCPSTCPASRSPTAAGWPFKWPKGWMPPAWVMGPRHSGVATLT